MMNMFIDILINNYVAAYIIMLVFLIGAVCRLVNGAILSGLIKESENMVTTRKNILKQIKLKYENCYKLGLQINNISVYISKCFNKNNYMRIVISRLSAISKSCGLICIACGVLAGTASYIKYQNINNMLLYAVLGFLLYFAQVLLGYMVNIDLKTDKLMVNIQDYLENNLKNKLLNEVAGVEEFTAKSALTDKEEAPKEESEDTARELDYQKEMRNNKIIEEILMEYL